jgi:hypothetical protein
MTAIQKLIETLKGYYGKDNLQAINFNHFIELEKEQIINARIDGVTSSIKYGAAMRGHDEYYEKVSCTHEIVNSNYTCAACGVTTIIFENNDYTTK